MKTIYLLLLVLLCAGVSAQTSNGLSDVAALLFKNVNTRLSMTEKNHLSNQLGFVLSGNKEQPFAQDKVSREFPFTATVLPTDINKDGNEEIFVSFGNTYTSGNTGSSIVLFVKDAKGTYVANLNFPGMVPDALATLSQGYPDLLIGGPGLEFPVWRWNGREYRFYKTVQDKEYDKLKKQGVDELSKAYQQKIM